MVSWLSPLSSSISFTSCTLNALRAAEVAGEARVLLFYNVLQLSRPSAISARRIFSRLQSQRRVSGSSAIHSASMSRNQPSASS